MLGADRTQDLRDSLIAIANPTLLQACAQAIRLWGHTTPSTRATGQISTAKQWISTTKQAAMQRRISAKGIPAVATATAAVWWLFKCNANDAAATATDDAATADAATANDAATADDTTAATANGPIWLRAVWKWFHVRERGREYMRDAFKAFAGCI